MELCSWFSSRGRIYKKSWLTIYFVSSLLIFLSSARSCKASTKVSRHISKKSLVLPEDSERNNRCHIHADFRLASGNICSLRNH
ncbi:hypothetical protein QBC43DRAFT_319475 [Cladorrhinum sp. PSN259]|nr:hypothetical protein QBC43DRAFT_319475 [Cladorrhinum sp. PSN259]